MVSKQETSVLIKSHFTQGNTQTPTMAWCEDPWGLESGSSVFPEQNGRSHSLRGRDSGGIGSDPFARIWSPTGLTVQVGPRDLQGFCSNPRIWVDPTCQIQLKLHSAQIQRIFWELQRLLASECPTGKNPLLSVLWENQKSYFYSPIRYSADWEA